MPQNALYQQPEIPNFADLYIKGVAAGNQNRSANQQYDINALNMRAAQTQAERDNTARNALSSAMQSNTVDGQVNYPAVGNAMSSNLASQNMGPEALEYQKKINAMTKEQLEMADKRMEKFKPIMFKAYSSYEDLLAKYKGDQAQAQQDMDTNYWPSLAKAAISAGAPADKVKPNYNHAETVSSMTVSEMLTEQLYKIRQTTATTQSKKATQTGGGKGGAVTSFIQIKRELERSLPGKKQDEYIALARVIYSEGKFNAASAAVRLKAAGMEDKDISTFLEGLRPKDENTIRQESRPLPTF